MPRSRREFAKKAARLAAATGTAWTSTAMATEDPQVGSIRSDAFYKVYPIGKVVRIAESTQIHVFDEYAAGLLGLDHWSHVNVFYWFHQNDVAQKRRILQVHPRGNRANPLTGVFACRAPVRPNLIALTTCRILSIENNVLTIDRIDAFDETPVIDLKPCIPPDVPRDGVKVPEWAGGKRPTE